MYIIPKTEFYVNKNILLVKWFDTKLDYRVKIARLYKNIQRKSFKLNGEEKCLECVNKTEIRSYV